MTSGQDDPGAGLGREVERMARRGVAIEARVDELAGLLEQLATDVHTLAARCGPGEGEEPRSWLLTEDPAQAVADLAELAVWLARVWLRYPDTMLPACWLWHPALVEELRWLCATHREAYDEERGSWSAAADWHDRLRPTAARRLKAAYAACELAEHAPGGTQHRPAPTAALAELADLAARHWATNPTQPLIPSDEQIQQAENHDTARHHSHQRTT